MLNVFVYRALQELLFNIVKHAGVKNARISLDGSGNDIVISVSDRGCGFDPVLLKADTASSDIGIGLTELTQRAIDIGGSLVIESRPNRGSCFRLTVPNQLEPTL